MERVEASQRMARGKRRAPVGSAILDTMRIATWNVNGLRARMDFVAHWLQSRAPDVVGLQEVKVSDEDFPYEDFQALGYHAVCPRPERLERRGSAQPGAGGGGHPGAARPGG